MKIDLNFYRLILSRIQCFNFMHLNSPLLSPSADLLEERRNSSAEKPRKMFARKSPVAGERIRARLQRTGKKFCFFSAVGETRASAPSAFIPPKVNLRLPLLPISCSILTICYRGAAQECFVRDMLPTKIWRQQHYLPHLSISNRGGGVGRQIP